MVTNEKLSTCQISFARGIPIQQVQATLHWKLFWKQTPVDRNYTENGPKNWRYKQERLLQKSLFTSANFTRNE